MMLRLGSVVVLALLVSLGAGAQERSFTDAAGRRVELPARVSRVFAAGPPASVAVYMVAPDKLVGWVRTPSAKEKAYLAEPYASLPETGRLTGRGNTANLEVLLTSKPDLVLMSAVSSDLGLPG